MPKIFISYRRSDTQPIVGRLYEHLARAFGDDNVFMDVQDIPAGEHFNVYLEQQVASCDVLLVIIGPQWLSAANETDDRRLDDPDDFVRIEVVSGLNREDVRVVPVLIHDTPMPDSDDLPEALRSLHYRNASRVRYDPDFTGDMLKLIGQLGGSSLGQTRATKIWRWVAMSLFLLFVLMILAVSIIGSGLLTRLFFPYVEVSQTMYARLTQEANQTATAAAVNVATHTAEPTSTEPAPSANTPPPAEGPQVTILAGATLRQAPDSDSPRAALVLVDTAATVTDTAEDESWLFVVLGNGQQGWARRDTLDIAEDFRWRVLFTSPDGNNIGGDSWSGIDLQFAKAIDETTTSIDLATFELDHPLIYTALLDAHQRGVTVRIVTDDETGLDVVTYTACMSETQKAGLASCLDLMATLPDETYLDELLDAGIPIVDDGRSALMHHNFAILDGAEVWAGSWNYTVNSTYRNNNNVLTLRDADVIARFQAEFNNMFEDRVFNAAAESPALPALSAEGQFSTAFFTPDRSEQVLPLLLALLSSAEDSVRLMIFSFTLDELGTELVSLHEQGVTVEAIMETRGAMNTYSEMGRLYCAGADVRGDGNPYILGHKVIIIDNAIVITGSMNLSASALESNNEDFIVVLDPALAEQYTVEFERLWADASQPEDVTCE